MDNLKKTKHILLTIFIVLMIPNIIVYAYHSIHEYSEAMEHIPYTETNHQGMEQLNEGIFFSIITIGYVITTINVITKPNRLKSYYIILIGTIVIIIVYYMSKTIGFPNIDFYDWIIIDNTTNWKDLVTKIAQQSFVIPLSILLGIIYTQKR
jgi:ABC-type proline/glycine betaine transport system permease subunit